MWGDRSQLYHRLATLCDAGIALRQAFHIMADSESASYRAGFQRAVDVLDAGGDVEDAVRQTRIFNPFEIAMMVAGANAGRLPEIFTRLAAYHEARSKRLRSIIGRIAYPFALLHAAILLPNLVILVQKGAAAYIWHVAGLLMLLYIALLAPVIAGRLLASSPSLASAWETILFAIPWYGSFARKDRLAQALTIWHGLYASGVPLLSTLTQAGEGSGSIHVRLLFVSLRRKLENGSSIPQAVAGETLLPREIRELICSGAIAGQLDKMLLTARNILDQEADSAMRTFIAAVGTIVFIAVAAFIAWNIISFYLGYFQNLSRFY